MRNRYYQHLLNSRRWRELRAWKLQANPLCEQCEAEGYIRSALDIHHIVPVESAKTEAEMEKLCFDPHNLRALCKSCHIKVHQEMGKDTRDNHQQRSIDRLARWVAKHANTGEDADHQEPLTSVKGG